MTKNFGGDVHSSNLEGGKRLKVLLWMPLPETSSWRGEGIAQVIEQIIKFTPEIDWSLFLSERAAIEAADEFQKLDNVRIFSSLGKMHTAKRRVTAKIEFSDIGELQGSPVISSLDLKSKFLNFAKRLSFLFYYVRMRLMSKNKIRAFSSKFDVIWVSTPVVPFVDKLPKDKVLCSFWDPFVFEYGSFPQATKKYFYNVLSKNFLNSVKISTQSEANKNYLSKVMDVPASKVELLKLATGDLREHVTEEMKAAKKSRNFIDAWPRKTFSFYAKKDVKGDIVDARALPKSLQAQCAEMFISDLTNSSSLLRLQNRLTKTSKIVIISTQNRPYKGMHTLFLIMRRLLADHPDTYFIFTGDVGKEQSKFPEFHENIINMPRVSNRQLAFLYLISDLALHPSYVEGGLGSSPQFEATSVGTPCIANYGRHIAEAEVFFDQSMDAFTHNFNDIEGVVAKIKSALFDEQTRKQNIKQIQQCQIQWDSVGREFMRIASSI